MMKNVLALMALVIMALVAYLIRNHADYGTSLPQGLPADIAIVNGEVISGRRTLFEDGKGYVIDIRTDLDYAEVVKFYADAYAHAGFEAAQGMGAQFTVVDFLVEGKQILMEIHSREAQTHVTMAIHLNKWW